MKTELQYKTENIIVKPYQILTCQDCNSQMYPYEVIFLNQKVSGYVCAFCGRMIIKKESSLNFLF